MTIHLTEVDQEIKFNPTDNTLVLDSVDFNSLQIIPPHIGLHIIFTQSPYQITPSVSYIDVSNGRLRISPNQKIELDIVRLDGKEVRIEKLLCRIEQVVDGSGKPKHTPPYKMDLVCDFK